MSQSLTPVLDPKADPATVILDDVALAERWGVSIHNLRYRRSMGKPGPKYFKIGRYVRYYLSDVLAYEQSQMRGGE